MTMDYLDDLFKEYLLFRGFTETLQTFSREKLADKGQAWQADAICKAIFARLIQNHDFDGLIDLLDFLRAHLFSKLPQDLEDQAAKLEASLLRLCLVRAIEDGASETVTHFFQRHGERLGSGLEAASWEPWFAVPFLQKPQKDPRFQVYFTKPWRQLLEVSWRNFLGEALQKLPLPAVLRFDADRRARQALQKKVEGLQAELARARGRPVMRAVESDADTSVGGGFTPAVAALPVEASEAGEGSEGNAEAWSLTDVLDPDYLAGAGVSAAATALPPRGPPGDRGSRLSLPAESDTEGGTSLGVPHGSSAEAGRAEEGWGATPSSSAMDGTFSATEAAHQGREEGDSHPGGGLRSDVGQATTVRPADDALRIPLSPDPIPAREEGSQDGSGVRSFGGQQEALQKHEAAITDAVFSADGRNLASASADGVVRICAPEMVDGNAARSAVLLCGAPVTRLSWDARADKVMLVGTRGKGVKAWHVDQKRMVAHVKPDPAFPDVAALACSPADPSFLCACTAGGRVPPTSGRLTLWNLRSFRKVHTFKTEAPISSAVFSPDGSSVAASGWDGHLQLFDTTTGASTAQIPMCQPPGGVGPSEVCFTGSSGANLLTLTADAIVRLWDPAMLQPFAPVWQADVKPHLGAGLSSQHPLRLAASPGGKTAAVTSGLGAALVVPLDGLEGTGSQVGRGHSHGKPVTAVAWHPTLDVLTSGSADGTVSVSRIEEW